MKYNQTLRLLVPLLLMAAAQVHAQTGPPGTVTVATNVTATAGTDPTTQVICTFTVGSGTIHTDCTVNAIRVFSTDAKPSPGAANGYVVSIAANGNSVTWLLQQQVTTGPITWQIAANGVMKSGTF